MSDGSSNTGWSSAKAIILTIFIFVFAQALAGISFAFASALLTGLSIEAQLSTNLDHFIYVFLSGLFVFGLVWYFLHLKGFSLAAIGLGKWPKASDLAVSVAGYLIYFVAFIMVGIVASTLLPINPDQEQNLGFQAQSGLALALAFVGLVILPPISEEVLFRGFLFSSLRANGQKFWVATVATSILFALPHLFGGFEGEGLLWFVGLDTLFLSVVLCYVREKTGALWSCIGIHAIKNCVAFIYLFVVVQ